ncbi:hypothetical protein A2U01_0110023, partial [Trifolium medium]|nr:hypothetical protein [Trifolium medium]
VPAQQDDPIAEDAPPEDAQQGERRWRDVVFSALKSFIGHIDADRDDDLSKDLFLALDVARGADID